MIDVARAPKQLSLEGQQYLHESGLPDPGVFESFESFLRDPNTIVEELAFETGDVSKLEEPLKQAQRAAHGQQKEFARARKPGCTKPKVPQNCKERSRPFLRGTVGVFPGWPEAQSKKEKRRGCAR